MELQKTLTPGEALERILRSYQTYYNIKTEAVEPPFAAEAIFGSHNEQYFLIKKAKVADIDTNETVYLPQRNLYQRIAFWNWTPSPGNGELPTCSPHPIIGTAMLS